MKFMLRLFSAFCVATVLAQAIVLALSAARGNLNSETMVKTVALLNGIDISGKRLQQMLDKSKQTPTPSYEDVVKERAQENLNLEMRQRSVQRYLDQLEALQASFRNEKEQFDQRKDSFHELLKTMEEKIKDEGLAETQRTLEALAPEQSKEQLLKMIKAGESTSVVAIIKGMQPDKRKKILGEFVSPEEAEQLHQILTQLRKGDPMANLIDQARTDTDSKPAPPSAPEP